MKYLGSKSRIAKYIAPIIQQAINKYSINIYIEPFVGGANLIDKIICKKKIGYDIDKYLIALLQHVQNGGELYESVPKELYDKARTAWYSGDTSEFKDWQIGCICYLASVNGRDFSAGYGHDVIEHCKNGKNRERHYYQEAKRNLLNQALHEEFYNIDFRVGDYRTIEIPKNCVVSLDPPYAGVKQYANSKHFDHDEFWEIARKWSQSNIVFISELEAPDDFECIWQQEVSRSVKVRDKRKAVEKLWKMKK